MEGRVLHQGERARPAGRGRVLGHDVPDPGLRAVVEGHELLQGEGLADAAAELSSHDLQLHVQPVRGYGIARRRLEAAIAVLPLSSRNVDHYRHGRRTYPLRRAANRRPRRIDLGEHLLTQLVAGTGQRECHVCVQTLESSGLRARAAHPEVELGP